MTTNKKLVITVGVMAVALILALTGIIVVLVTANQRASSAVNVKYTSSDVAVTLSATAYLGSNTYQFTKGGVVGGETELVLSPTVTEGSLSQTNDIASFDLTKTNDYIVFEYVFQNETGNIDVKIDQDGIPATRENIDLTYTYSDTQITNFATLEDNTEFTAQLLPAYTGEETVKYVYIKAQISDLLYDSSLVGDFGWALSKPQTSEINTVTLSVSDADYIERSGSNLSNTTVTSNYVYKTFANSVDVTDIGIYPAVANKAFVGWSETAGGTVISTIEMPSVDITYNTLRGTSAKILYPIYKEGSVPEENYVVQGSYVQISGDTIYEEIYDLVVPDVVSCSGKIYKVKDISKYMFMENEYIESVYIGRYLTTIGDSAFASCYELSKVDLGVNLQTIGGDAFIETSIRNLVIPDNVQSIGGWAFPTLTTIYIGDSLSSIGNSALSISNSNKATITVSEGNQYYDSRNNCNALIETKTNKLLLGCKQTVMPDSIKIIASDAFVLQNFINSELQIPYGVEEIESSAFDSCNITAVNIPSTVKKMGVLSSERVDGNGFSPFVDCHSLTTIIVDPRNEYYDSRNNCNAIIDTRTNTLIQACNGTTEIPDTVEVVNGQAFNGCTLLTEIYIPASVVLIYRSAFAACSAVETITFEITTNWQKAQNVSFDNAEVVDMSDPTQNAKNLTLTNSFTINYRRV